MRSVVLVACGVAAISLGACSLMTSFDSLAGGSAGDAGSDASADASPSNADGSSGGGGEAGSTDGGMSTQSDGSADAGMCPPWVLPATCDPQFISDSKNCCVAGRDCQGGACTNGKCQPVTVLADATTDARGIVVAGDSLVWATGCTAQLRRVSKLGAGNTSLPPGSTCTPTPVVTADNLTAFWIEYDGPHLNTTSVDGKGVVDIVAQVPVSGAKASFDRLAIDGTNAYWAMATPPSVWYAPLDGKAVNATPLATASSLGTTKETAQNPYGVAVNAKYVYWADTDGATIKRRALSTLGMDILADVIVAETGPRDLTIDANNLYWLTSGGDVRSRAIDGSGKTVVLSSGETSAEWIIVDDQYVYFTHYAANAAVSRVRKDGTANAETLGTGQSYPYGITQDCTTVYWTNQANFTTGSIMKVTK
jgi:hypothetical protein